MFIYLFTYLITYVGLMRGHLTPSQQPMGARGRKRREENERYFVRPEPLFAKCIVTKTVIWLLNRLGLS